MQVMLGLDDWLALELPRLLRESSAEGIQRVVMLATLASGLLRQVEDAPGEPVDLTPPEASVVDALQGDLQRLPTQLAFVQREEGFGQWLELAALAEQLQLDGIARLMLDALRRAQGRITTHSTGGQSAEQRERVGVCWTRRGRIDRTAGHLDSALECYQQAIRVARGLPIRDARPLAELGLAALAANRGNFPAAGRRAAALLRSRPAVHTVHRFAAHSLLAFVRRKSGRLLDSMLHGWAAYDLVPLDDIRGLEILLTMSELATELGDLDAAEQGFAAMTHDAIPTRVRISAIVGAANVHLRRTDSRREQRERLVETLTNTAAFSAPPRELTRVLLALAELELADGHILRAAGHAERARLIAHEFRLFEQQFLIEELLRRISSTGLILESSSRNVSTPSTPRGPSTPDATAKPTRLGGSASARHPALSRLLVTASRVKGLER